MNSELLNRLPRLKKLSAAGWEREGEQRVNAAALGAPEETHGLGASGQLMGWKEGMEERKKRGRQTSLAVPEDPGLRAGCIH